LSVIVRCGPLLFMSFTISSCDVYLRGFLFNSCVAFYDSVARIVLIFFLVFYGTLLLNVILFVFFYEIFLQPKMFIIITDISNYITRYLLY
jgi:hypothetical protein